MSGGIIIRTVPNVMQAYGCSAETAQRYVDLRDEGYSMAQAQLMAGLSDPPGSQADTYGPTRMIPNPEPLQAARRKPK